VRRSESDRSQTRSDDRSAEGCEYQGNAAAYAAAGADVLVTSAPYAAPPIDVTLRMSEG
jgi:molybdenum transport protein